jgi:N-acyl amino acid synthase of PEP-CTERM/exosortase system
VLLFRDPYFDGYVADTDSLRERTYRLRYQVYCIERGFEPTDQPNPGQERDRYDAHSMHFLLHHRERGVDVGTTRLVLGEAPGKLPFFRIAGHCLNKPDLPACPPSAEVSRLAISKACRRRHADRNLLYGAGTDPERLPDHATPGHPGVVIALYRCLYAYSKADGIADWYMMMEPALARLLGQVGVVPEPLGPAVHYRGLRVPYRINVQGFIDQIRRHRPDVASYIDDDAHGVVRAAALGYAPAPAP